MTKKGKPGHLRSRELKLLKRVSTSLVLIAMGTSAFILCVCVCVCMFPFFVNMVYLKDEKQVWTCRSLL